MDCSLETTVSVYELRRWLEMAHGQNLPISTWLIIVSSLVFNIIFLIRTQISVGRWWGLARSAQGPVEGHEMFTNTSVFQKLQLGMCPFS